MFCFCLQSSLLKLQALEVEGGASLAQSPDEGSPAQGSKEKKSPCGPPELRGNEGKTPALCHGVFSDENNLPGTCLSDSTHAHICLSDSTYAHLSV